MFFFIGMHTSEKDYGVEGYHTCTRCGHVGHWHRCPGCGGTAEMTKEEFMEAAARNGELQ